jgi:aminoglycoside 2''-phosphotransferase
VIGPVNAEPDKINGSLKKTSIGITHKMDDFLEKQLSKIKEVFPSIVESVTVHDNGDDFVVLEINREWMFRFPRNDVSRKVFTTEKTFLASFKDSSPLPVPDYRYHGHDFSGYRKISGETLRLELFRGLSKITRERMAQQIGQFLSAVHTFPVDEARRLGLIEGWNGWHDKMVHNFRDVVLPELTPAAQRNALACIDRLLAEPFNSKVIHGDFALEDHVFFDEQRQELSGVIDFADVTLNDASHDFQNIVEYGGNEFFEAVMDHYQGVVDPMLLERTKLRIEARPLFEASYSLLFGFEKRFKERMDYIETKFGA